MNREEMKTRDGKEREWVRVTYKGKWGRRKCFYREGSCTSAAYVQLYSAAHEDNIWFY